VVFLCEVRARMLGEVITAPCTLLDLGNRLADRFSDLSGDRLCVLAFVLPEDVTCGPETPFTLTYRPFTPVVEGGNCLPRAVSTSPSVWSS